LNFSHEKFKISTKNSFRKIKNMITAEKINKALQAANLELSISNGMWVLKDKSKEDDFQIVSMSSDLLVIMDAILGICCFKRI